MNTPVPQQKSHTRSHGRRSNGSRDWERKVDFKRSSQPIPRRSELYPYQTKRDIAIEHSYRKMVKKETKRDPIDEYIDSEHFSVPLDQYGSWKKTFYERDMEEGSCGPSTSGSRAVTALGKNQKEESYEIDLDSEEFLVPLEEESISSSDVTHSGGGMSGKSFEKKLMNKKRSHVEDPRFGSLMCSPAEEEVEKGEEHHPTKIRKVKKESKMKSAFNNYNEKLYEAKQRLTKKKLDQEKKKEAAQLRRENRRKHHKTYNQKNAKGQPLFKSQIEQILHKLQNN